MHSFITRSALALLAAVFLFATTSIAQTDTLIGISTPSGAGGSYQKLAHALCNELSSDQLKANAIYNWITHNISYDVKALQQGKLKEEDPKKVFKQRKGMCGGYSLLFAAMCNEVGVRTLTIDGYSKDWMFDDGDKLYLPRHAWNVVYVDKRWRLVDATWGAGRLVQTPGWLKQKINKAANNPLQTSGKLKFRFVYDTAYFLSDPLAFRLRHLPSDPVWQLTATTMPLDIFEAGTLAIEQFNKQYPQLAENTPEQNELSALDERARIQASAERQYQYNPRFHIAIAAKHQADAADSITANADGSMITSGLALADVRTHLKQAEEEVKEQKKILTTEYNALSLKNKAKNQQAKQYVNQLHSGNKRMIGQCESRIKRINSLSVAINKKAVAAAKSNKEIDANKLSGIATGKKQTEIHATALTSLEDSVSNRKARMQLLQESITSQQNTIAATKEINGKRLDTLADFFILADSALTWETINRIQMHDNYDEEILQWNRLVKTIRLEQVDSKQKDYFAAYDSVNNDYEALRKDQWEVLQLSRKNLADIERYKRKNDNPAFTGQYSQLAQKHGESLAAYYQTLEEHKSYVEGHRTLFKELVKLYTRQEKLAGYMEKSEDKRQKLEEKSLTKKEDFDKKENKKQAEQLKTTGKLAEKMLSLK